MRVKILGSAAGGGFPQWNCACPNCRGVGAFRAELVCVEDEDLGAECPVQQGDHSVGHLHHSRLLRRGNGGPFLGQHPEVVAIDAVVEDGRMQTSGPFIFIATNRLKPGAYEKERRRVPGQKDRSAGGPRQPATRVHVDHTARSGPQRVRDLLPDEAEELLKGRVQVINLWRPIRGPLQDAPLAVCDARTVHPADEILIRSVATERSGNAEPAKCRCVVGFTTW